MDKTTHTCIACSTSFSGNFCDNCGERAVPKPITIKTFFSDVLSETISFETPFLFTLKSLLKGPGKVPRKFIAGNRKTYAKPLGFFVLMTGVNYLLSTWVIDVSEMVRITKTYMLEMIQSIPNSSQVEINEIMASAENNPLSQDKLRQLYFLMLPFLALFSWLFFRKSNYNFMENVVALLYIQGGTLLFSIISILLGLISLKVTFHFGTIVNLASLVYIVWGIHQFHRQKSAISIFKALLVYILAMLTSGIIFYWINPVLS